MFERYTEKARRVIFFAREEASNFGRPQIETEHLLLGLLKECPSTLNLYLEQKTGEEEIRAVLMKLTPPPGKRIPTSVDLPLSDECQRILTFSSEEATQLGHQFIGTEHLMLGILRESSCLAARLLRERGLDLEKARLAVTQSAQESAVKIGMSGGSGGALPKQMVKAIHFVEAGQSEPIFSAQNLSLLPRINDKIRIHGGEGSSQFYRVQDVIWEYRRNASITAFYEVTVQLSNENSG